MVEQNLSVPVIAIDGGAGTGKGTARSVIAHHLGFHSLDSGVLYRALGLMCHRTNLTTIPQMVEAALALDIQVDGERVLLCGKDETATVRGDEAGKLASNIGSISEVRQALLDFQLQMRKAPGLVSDGRDQGEVFDTPFRYFFVCDAEVRARRRVVQFERMNMPAEYDLILEEIRRRDIADETRIVQPLKPHPTALVIDTSHLTIEQMAETILTDYEKRK